MNIPEIQDALAYAVFVDNLTLKMVSPDLDDLALLARVDFSLGWMELATKRILELT